jgi:hypothetical protein
LEIFLSSILRKIAILTAGSWFSEIGRNGCGRSRFVCACNSAERTFTRTAGPSFNRWLQKGRHEFRFDNGGGLGWSEAGWRRCRCGTEHHLIAKAGETIHEAVDHLGLVLEVEVVSALLPVVFVQNQHLVGDDENLMCNREDGAVVPTPYSEAPV